MLEHAFGALDLVGYSASCLMAAGVLLVAQRRAVGWLVKIAACALWMGFALVAGYSSIFVESGVFIFLNLYGWRAWSRRLLSS